MEGNIICVLAALELVFLPDRINDGEALGTGRTSTDGRNAYTGHILGRAGGQKGLCDFLPRCPACLRSTNRWAALEQETQTILGQDGRLQSRRKEVSLVDSWNDVFHRDRRASIVRSLRAGYNHRGIFFLLHCYVRIAVPQA